MSDEDGFDAGAFARSATGETTEAAAEAAETATESHAVAEGVEASGDVGSVSTFREMLMAQEPEVPLEEVESLWNPAEGGDSRIKRAGMKATGVDGMPAILDFVIGVGEMFVQMNFNTGDDGEDSSDDPPTDPAGGPA